MVVQSYEAGTRTAEVIGMHGAGGRYAIPASYFHATATTKAGKRRITGYYLTGTLDD
ncbi:hypothetical protein N7925_00145 [Streptomyces sp. CA-278952]|uniref:hypothetical protein n=1 Tax=unclassified Streptomyces TaxID=2593676 RepID=UPI002368DB2D|nr:hypothetical protein [Streptomyces sp. CA-278952]WDG26850.1 hypothetical protein N7925_00145 [Streptomyces sp. CA-278952]